jgi:hypothetical protein
MSEASASPPQPTVAKRSVTSRRRSSIPFLGSPKSVDQITVMVAEEESKLPDRNSADAIRRRANTLHEQMVRSLRRAAWVNLATATTCGVASFALALCLAAALPPSASARWLPWCPIVIAFTAAVVTLVQAGLAVWQLHATDADRMAKAVAALPPEYISVNASKPPLLQALDVLSQMRERFLTEGSPSSPRLLIRAVDDEGRPVESGGGRSSVSTIRSRTRDIVREPLLYSKAKIRQAAKDRLGMKWEESMSLQQNESHGSGSSSGGAAGGKDASPDAAGGGDVHGFITANYGSALRYTLEAGRASNPRVLKRQATSITDAKVEAARTSGLALPLPAEMLDPAKRILQAATVFSVDGWAFDPFELTRCTNDHALLFLGHHCLAQSGLYEQFGLDLGVVLTFLQNLELAYRNNPYHNREHACDVLQGAMWLLHSGSTDAGGGNGGAGGGNGGAGRTPLSTLMQPVDVLALLIAAAGHDSDHTGQNNAYHVATNSDLAIVYNDRSVLESHHCATLFSIARKENSDLFAALPLNQRREVRDIIIQMVLSTDMAVHFKNVDRLSAVLQSGDLDLSKREEKTFVLEMVIHSADIANPCRSEKIYRQWTERVMQEFYEQGDLEKANGLPVSKFFDRTAPNVPKCQLGFIDFVVRPLMEVVNELLDIQVLVDNLASNRRLMELEAAEASAATPGT